MSAVYWNKTGGNKRITELCPTAALLWPATRILCDVHWRWDPETACYNTHQWTRDSFYKDVRHWPAPTALSSLLRALREDDRLAGDPMLRLMGLYIAMEYTTSLWGERR